MDVLRANARAQMLPFFRSLEPALISQSQNRSSTRSLISIFGVLCLSERWDSILMWGHYAYSHEGFVIGLDTKHPFFNQRRSPTDEFGFLRRVRYQTSRPVVSLMSSGALEWFETKADVWACRARMAYVSGVLFAGRRSEACRCGVDSPFRVPLGLRYGSDSRRKIRNSATEGAVVSVVASFPNTPAIYRCGIDDADYKITRRKA